MKWGLVKKMIFKYEKPLKWLLFFLIFLTLSNLIYNRRHQFEYINWFEIFNENIFIFIGLLILTFINWGLEAKKWQILTGNPSFYHAYRTVLVGLIFKQFIPFGGLGDISGRALADRNTQRNTVVGSFLLSSFFQFSVSFLFGLYGLIWLIMNTSFPIGRLYLWSAFIGSAGLIVILLKREWLALQLNKWFFTLKNVEKKWFVRIFLISLTRYLVFFTQALVLFTLFSPFIKTDLVMAGITFIYFAKTILPSLGFLGDLGIREISAAFFFGQFEVAVVPIIVASLFIWLINVFLPSIVALFFTHKLKLQ